jgi:hypothetical protein
MLAFLAGIYSLLWRDGRDGHSSWNWTQYAWVAVMVIATGLGVRSTLHLQRAVREEYAYRLALQTQSLLAANALRTDTGIRYIAFTESGYHLAEHGQDAAWIDSSLDDDLSFTNGPGHVWVERALSPHSKIVDVRDSAQVVLEDARDPMLSANGQELAFVRDCHGRGQLIVRRAFQSASASEAALTSRLINVYEASFLSESAYAFSAVENGRPPQIYLTDAAHSNALLALGESRYPALSPDGRHAAILSMACGIFGCAISNAAHCRSALQSDPA